MRHSRVSETFVCILFGTQRIILEMWYPSINLSTSISSYISSIHPSIHPGRSAPFSLQTQNRVHPNRCSTDMLLKISSPASFPAGTTFYCTRLHFLDYPSEQCLFLYVNTSKCRSAEIISISSLWKPGTKIEMTMCCQSSMVVVFVVIVVFLTWKEVFCFKSGCATAICCSPHP